MSDDRAGTFNESDPGDKDGSQLPGVTTKGDHDDRDRAGAGEGPDADSDTKTQDLAKAGRKDFDPNDGQE